MFDVTAKQYLMASVAAVGLGAVLGVVGALLRIEIGWFLFLTGILAAGIGYLVGEAVSVAANRKRGLGLSLIATSGVVIAFAAATITTLAQPVAYRYDLFNIVTAVLLLALAVYISVSRVR